MQYCLVLKLGRDNYQPFDLNHLSMYDNEDIRTIEGIDLFTSKFSNEDELKATLLKANYIEEANLDNQLKIIYYENNHFRENKYGVCYKDNYEFICEEKIVDFFKENITNFNLFNRLYNEFRLIKEPSSYIGYLLECLKKPHEIQIEQLIYNFEHLTYLERRNICLFIFQNFNDIINVDRKKGEKIERRRISQKY